MMVQTATAAWEALWTCPECGGRRIACHWDSVRPVWHCACGWWLMTRQDWDILNAWKREIGFTHIDPHWLAKWNVLPEVRRRHEFR